MNFKYIILIFSIALVYSCGNDYEITDYFDLEELPGYVAFNAPGNSITLDDEMTTEDGGTVSLNIECPTGTLTDISVDYDFGGSAVFGTDFNVAGASASGGTITIKAGVTDVTNRANADIDIEILMDGVQDGEKTITVTLVSASNSEGTLAVGRGGKDLLKTANVIIEDID